MRPLPQGKPAGRVKTDENHNWRRCAQLASRQDGTVARWQLLKAGLSRDTIKRWLRKSLLHPCHHGVYSVGHPALSLRGRLRAALLACGDGAVLSHISAAYLWGLLPEPPTTVDVTLIRRQCRSRSGIRVHQVSGLDRRDIRIRHGLQVTSPARTLIDLAATVSLHVLERLVSEARATKLLRPGELEAALARAGHRSGVARVRAFLEAEDEPEFTRSEGERTIRRLLRQARLSQPRTNVRIGRWTVDFLWPEEKLVVEFDGFQFHGHRSAFERDRRKGVELANAGYEVLRFTWRQLRDEPLVVIAAIASALGRRSGVAA